MMGRAPALVALMVWALPGGSHGQVPATVVPPATAPDSISGNLSEPVRFDHDLFFLQVVSGFSVGSSGVNTTFPGPLGLTEDRLAERLPGVGFRRNGVPLQAGEFHWFGGDGGSIGWSSDELNWNIESLGFPYYGAGDPALIPPLGDTLFLLAAPLLSTRPAEIVSWRDPSVPDSLHAVALHANGPDGFSHTGGRLRGPLGGGYEFDGQFYRDFSDGRLAAAASDGHALDFELRRRISGWPARLRFRQARGERALAFRWNTSAGRASHRYLLTDLQVATARPDEAGEWMFGAGLRHEDQKLASPILSERRVWFGRTLSASVSRLSRGKWTRNVTIRSAWRMKDDALSLPPQKSAELAVEVYRALSRMDLLLTGAARSETDQDPLWRAAVAVAWKPLSHQRVTVAAGRSLEAPDLLRRLLPTIGGVGGYSESGDPDLKSTVHESASLGWNYVGETVRIQTLAATGRSRDLAVWQPVGDESSHYMPISLERRYSGVSALIDWRPLHSVLISGGVDHLLDNEWKNGGEPVYAPEDSWFAELRWRIAVRGTHVQLLPRVAVRGARGGSLSADYHTYAAGCDLAVKQLLIFWRMNNLDDSGYRTGGSALSYGRHFEYGFRWEFWN